MTLYHAASKAVADDVPVWLGSTGGLVYGLYFYDSAFEIVTADFGDLGFAVDENLQQLAFRFGVCLRDVEVALGETAAWTSDAHRDVRLGGPA